jgi:hypothetical protein
MWDMGMDIIPAGKTFYTTQYHKAFLMYGENEYCAKHHRMLVIQRESVPNRNRVPSAASSGSGQSYPDLYALSSEEEYYNTPDNMAETPPGGTDHAARFSTSASPYFNSPPDAPKNGANYSKSQ